MRNKTNRKPKNLFLIAVLGVVLIAAVLACGLDWNAIISGNGNPNEIVNPPLTGELTSGVAGDAAAEIGSVAPGYTPSGTPLNQSNAASTLRTATSGNYYLTEDITGFAYNGLDANNGDAYVFGGTLDGNGHSITIAGGSATFYKAGGGVFGSLNGTMKNLTVIYNSSLTVTRAHGDGNLFGAGLAVGMFRGGTIENVRVVLNSGVTFTGSGNGNLIAVGGLVGQIGQSSASKQTINRSKVELNGTLSCINGDQWTAVGGMAGYANSNKWVTEIDLTVDGFVLTGSGKFNLTGWGKRNGGLIGSYVGKSTTKVTVNDYVYDLTATDAYATADKYGLAIVSGWDNGDGGRNGTVNVNYGKTTRSDVRGSSSEYGTNTQKGTINLAVPTGVTFNGLTLDASNVITFMLTSSKTDYSDYAGYAGTSRRYITNNWRNFDKINARIATVNDLSSGQGSLSVLAPENVSNGTQLSNALTQGRSVSVGADINLGAAAFQYNVDFGGIILGNGKTLTYTGLGSGYGGIAQGGLIKSINGGAIEDLNLVFSGTMTKSISDAGEAHMGLVAGEAKDATLKNVKVKVTGGTVTLTSTGGNTAVGGLFGAATGKVTVDAAVVDVAAGAKLTGGSTSVSWTWVGGFAGSLLNGTSPLTVNKFAVTGGGAMESLTNNTSNGSRRVGGFTGGIRIGATGAVTVTDFVLGIDDLSGVAARVALYDNGGGASPQFSVDRYYYLNNAINDFVAAPTSTSPVLTNKTEVLQNVYDKTDAPMTAVGVALQVNDGFTRLALNVSKFDFDPDFMWTIELKNASGVTLDSATLLETSASYTLTANLEAHTSLKIQMKQSRSISLPEDANRYEHGFVNSGYAAQQGYFGNPDWTEINTAQNGTMLPDLSGSGNYFLSEDLTIAGFASTHNFSGVLDGCGHTITIINDSGSNGKDGSLGGLFAELTGTVKNVRVVVKTSVARTSVVLRFGLLAGRMDAGAKVYNTKVSLATGNMVSIENSAAVTVGGLAGLVEGSNAVPVEMTGVTVEVNGEIRATGPWSWVGGIVGRVGVVSATATTGTRKLVAKQVILRGDNGKINNVNVGGTATVERSAGFGLAGGYGTSVPSTMEVDGFIFEFAGEFVGEQVALAAIGDASGAAAVARFSNVYKSDNLSLSSGLTWYYGFQTASITLTNQSTVLTAFTRNGLADFSLGYTVALFDPAAVNTTDGTVNPTDSLIVAAIFEDGKETQYFIADIEIFYGAMNKTGTDAVGLVNVFKLTPTEEFGEIRVQIRSGSASDGKAGVTDGVYNNANTTYADGWLTDNGRIPAMVGIPVGATAIDNNNALAMWLEGKNSDGALLDHTSTAYLYGYITSDFNMSAPSMSVRNLAAGRTLDGAGYTLSINTGATLFGKIDSLTDWMTGAGTANSVAAYGELVAVNAGTIKNLTLDVNATRTYTEPANGLLYGIFAAVNEGIIENCKTIIQNGVTVGVVGRNSGRVAVFGGVAAINSGSIRYTTIENNGIVDLSNGISNQKIAGGIAGVNDGGMIEYIVSLGGGNYTIGNSKTYKAFLGGVVGYARISSAATAIPVYGAGILPAQGIVRNILHNFSGKFRTGAATTQGLYYGAIAGYLLPAAPGSVNAATGLFASVVNGAGNMSYGFFQANGTVIAAAQDIAYNAMFGSDANTTNTNYGGAGAIAVNYKGTANAVAGGGEHHFWWDYWGGTGELRYEVYDAAHINTLNATGDNATANQSRGSAAIADNTVHTGGARVYTITSTFYGSETYLSYLNGIKSYGSGAAQSGSPSYGSGWTDWVNTSFYNNGNTRLTGGGNVYLSGDVTIDVGGKAGGGTSNFTGTFDGMGHTITLTGSTDFNQTSEWYGLIADALSGTIRNVKIVYAANFKRWVTQNKSNGQYRSGIIVSDLNGGTIENVTVQFNTDSVFWAELNSNAGLTSQQYQYNYVGVFAAKQNGGTIKNSKVDFGTNGTVRCTTNTGTYGKVRYNAGLIGWQTGNGVMENMFITGKGQIRGMRRNEEDNVCYLGMAVGKQESGAIRNLYLENLEVRLIQENATAWEGEKGQMRGHGGNQSGTITNVYQIGSVSIPGGDGGAATAPNMGVVSGTFIANSLDAMIAIFQNENRLISQVTNGVDSVSDSLTMRNLYVSLAEYKKSNFEAGYNLVVRYPELGYYLATLASGSTALTTANNSTSYGVQKVTAVNQIPTNLSVGIRAKVNLVYNKEDAKGNAVAEIAGSSAITDEYSGTNATRYEFRPVFWGSGKSGEGSTVALGWNVGGKITSGRIPTDTAPSAEMKFASAGYAYQNAAANAEIAVDMVHFSGKVTYQVVKTGLKVESDTAGADAKNAWKDRGLLTFCLTNTAAADGAITQVVYSVNGGAWQNVLKCNNYQNGQASVSIAFESARGGSRIRFKAYSGVSEVTTESDEVIVRVDTSYPTVTWEEGSAFLSGNNAERILIVDDVSAVDLTKADDVLKISGPDGHNLDYELTADWETSGKIEVFVPDASAALSGQYTFTVKDALGRTSSITETLDFTPPAMDASVAAASYGEYRAINNANTDVRISLSDNNTSAENVLKTLKVYFIKKGMPIAADNYAIPPLSVADDTITTTGFDTATGTGTVTLQLPDAFYNGEVDMVFEVADDAGNVRRVSAFGGYKVILDTREYTLNVMTPTTDDKGYDSVSYRINGSLYTAVAGTGDVLHILSAHLFDTIEIVFNNKTGYTYDGYRVLENGASIGAVPNGDKYTLGGLTANDLFVGSARQIVFDTKEELKVGITTSAEGAGALKNGNYSNTIADYAGELPNFLSLRGATVYTYDAAAGDYVKIKGTNLAAYFEVSMIDPNGAPIEINGDGILTFAVDPDDPASFIEGAYTLNLALKADLADKYTVLEGLTATFNVSAKSRRSIEFTYPGASAEFVYNGTQALFDNSGNILTPNGGYQSWVVDFASNAFDEEPETDADKANLATLKSNLDKLNYTLYYGGVFMGSSIGGTVTGQLNLKDVGNYYLTVSIPVTGAGKFEGVTGSKQITIAVTKKSVEVYADAQNVVYGDKIDQNGFYFDGIVAEDTKSGDPNGVRADGLKADVLTSSPRVSTEYTNVRVINGAVSAYPMGSVLTGGIAKNYNFILHSADVTIVPRDIILKIADTRKTYGETGDPSLLFWGLSDTASVSANGVTYTNKGFGYTDNYLSFSALDFMREAGEEAGVYQNNVWTQNSYAITGRLINPNYNVYTEPGAFKISRRELRFNVNGAEGLVFEEGIEHRITAKIANAAAKDNLSVEVVYTSGDWTSIGTHYYKLVVSQDGIENSDKLFSNYTYNQADVPVVIGASVLNVVVLPQVLVYGENPYQDDTRYVLEGCKSGDEQYIKVTLNIPKEYQTVGYHAGAIEAVVSFTSSDVNYTAVVRKGNLTVLPKEVELNWSGDFNSVYTGEALDKRITATVKSETVDPLQVQITFANGAGGASEPRNAGNYVATAMLLGTNSENYIVNAEDRTRQFVVQKSEQRIGLQDAYASGYDPSNLRYPTFNTESQFKLVQNGFEVWRARIYFTSLLAVRINGANGYIPSAANLPTLTIYASGGINASGQGENKRMTIDPNDTDYFDLEAGTYTAVAELKGRDNYYSNTYLFTFVVKDSQNNKLNTAAINGNSIDKKDISGSFVASEIGETVQINDSGKLGYVIGPNAKHRSVVVNSTGVSRTMANSLEGTYLGSAYNTQLSDGYYGSHDGDWAYAYFNIAVSDELRQLILQGKVKMQLSVDAASQKAGMAWTTKGVLGTWVPDSGRGAWREDMIDTTNLSYMVREISSAEDTTPDAADSSWVGLNDVAYDIGSKMQQYGKADGYSVLTNGLEQLKQGERTGTAENATYEWYDPSNRDGIAYKVGETYRKDVTLSGGSLKGGSAFRVYFASTTLGSTRTDMQISGDLGRTYRFLGNKRNNFAFENIKVTFLENTEASNRLTADTYAPEVAVTTQRDEKTGGMKYRFDVKEMHNGVEGTGINFSSVKATVGGINLTPGNGLSLVSKEYASGSGSPVLIGATFETGVMPPTTEVTWFYAEDYAGNRYAQKPVLSKDTTSPTIGDIKISPGGAFDEDPDLYVADETFWYNKRQYLSASVEDNTEIYLKGIYTYTADGMQKEVPSRYESGRVVSEAALGTGLYYFWAEDKEGNRTVVTFNLLVDESLTDGGLEIVLDPNVVVGDGEEGSWQKGNVVIENSVTKFGNSFGRMYYATADTDFRGNMDDPSLNWFAMDVEVADGKLVLSETIKTATKKYYAFKYVAGAASYPGAGDNATVYSYLGLIMIDREDPSIAAAAYAVSERNGTDPDGWMKAGVGSGEWTNKDVVFELNGTTGLSKGRLEYTLNGLNADDSKWLKPGDAGYEIYYYDYVSGEYTQTYDPERVFNANNAAKTSFDCKAYLLLTGQNTGNVYAFRFRNEAGSVAESDLGVTADKRDLGFKVAIDTTAPEVTSINSSWQPSATKSQIYIRESDSGAKSVLVYKQRIDADGNGLFEDGKPLYESDGTNAELTNGRWYFTFTGLWYKIVVTDLAGNEGSNDVKLKIDAREPEVKLLGIERSNTYVEPGASAEEQWLGNGVWAYRDASGQTKIVFRFEVKGGISGFTFAYSTVGFTSIESEWIKLTGSKHSVAELDQDSGGYTKTVVFEIPIDLAEYDRMTDQVRTYLFRFTSGAQKSVYFNFENGAQESYNAANENKYNYRVNIDATTPEATGFEYRKDDQWFLLDDYDDTNWVTDQSIGIRFKADDPVINHASTGLDRVTVEYRDLGGGIHTDSLVLTDGYYSFEMTRHTEYTLRIYDQAGNVYEKVFPALKIDLVAPEIAVDATAEGGAPYTSGTPTNKNVTLRYSLRYGDSGIVSILFTKDGAQTVYTEEELLNGIPFAEDYKGVVTLAIRNGAGITVIAEFEVFIDTVRPTYSVEGLPDADVTDPVEVTVTVEDNASGVQNAALSYREGDSLVTIEISGTYTFTVRDWRTYTVSVTDGAGNENDPETAGFKAKVDATMPENFKAEVTSGGTPYVSGSWSVNPLEFLFDVVFQTVEGETNFGNVEYRVDGSAWQVLFQTSDASYRTDVANRYRYIMEGEANARYEFRAVTPAGNPSVAEDNFVVEQLMLDTVTPELQAQGYVGGIGGTEFVPDETGKGYAWIAANVTVVFGYRVGVSGAKLYVEYKKDAATADYTRTELVSDVLKDGGELPYYVVENEGFYRFALETNAAERAEVDYFEIKRDETAPALTVSARQGAEGNLRPYTLASWTKEDVVLTVSITLGASYLDSKLLVKNNAGDYAAAEGYDATTATEGGDGLWHVVYTLTLTENQQGNYDFRLISGAGITRSEGVTRAGGAIRIDKNKPLLEIESVTANGLDYARFDAEDQQWVSGGWTNQNVTFTFKVTTFLSGGTLKYTYPGLAGYSNENIASKGSSVVGEDGSTMRRYTLTLAGENSAINATLKFRVESGAGEYSNTDADPKAEVDVQIDKTRPAFDENSLIKTPNVPANTFTAETVSLRFRVYDPETAGIAAGIRSVVFGKMDNSIFIPIGEELLADVSGYYTVSVTDNDHYLVRITDNAGNVTERAVKENVDKIQPEIRVNVLNGYVPGALSTSPVSFDFKGSLRGVSGAKAQYSFAGGSGEWFDAVDVDGTFLFDKMLFDGTLYFRLISGSGVASVQTSVNVRQDLNDYAVTVTERVVEEGKFSQFINYVKNGISTSEAPVMKNGEELTLQITEKAEHPLYKAFVGGAEVEIPANKQIKITVTGDTRIELVYKQIVTANFGDGNLRQSIRVVNGKNTPVVTPFIVTGGAGFSFTAEYERIKDAYGNAVSGERTAEVPQSLGAYRVHLTVTGGYTDLYEFAADSEDRVLEVYYFDRIVSPNAVYYAVESAYDLRYIRYSMADGVEYRQTKDLDVTADVAGTNGGDWTVGDLSTGVYNGANYKITIRKMVAAGVPVFGKIDAGATLKNVGVVLDRPSFTVADGGSYAAVAESVAGSLNNVYVTGTVSLSGVNLRVAAIVAEVRKDGRLTNAFSGLKLDLTAVTGEAVTAAGLAVENEGTIENSFSAGSIIGAENFRAGDMLSVSGSGRFVGAVSIASTLYSGTDVLESQGKDGATVVKYWDLNDTTNKYWDTQILAETLSPKADQVNLKQLVDAALQGLKFETDDEGNRYVAVSRYEQLLMIDDFPWADFRQTADIDAGNRSVAIAQSAPFTGSYDGQGFVIENVNITATETGAGLFGYVTGTIQNLVVKELNVSASSIAAAEAVVGGLVKELVGGEVKNVSVGGTVVAGIPGGTLVVGGVVGRATAGAKLSQILNTVSVTTEKATKYLYAGSVVGTLKESRIENVYSIAKVDGNFTKRAAVGQLVGMIDQGAGAYADNGYSVLGVTYVNGLAMDQVVGYDVETAGGSNFNFIPFSDMMDANRNPDFMVGGKHVSNTLKTLFPFQNGTGVESDPFEIRTAEEFRLIGNYLYAHYNVMEDIDFGGEWATIGKGMKFTGSIRGVNSANETVRKLSGLTDALVDQNYGTIQGLELQVTRTGSVSSNTVFGAAANQNYGTISFVKANGTVELNAEKISTLTVGGIAGENYGYIGNAQSNFRMKFGTVNLKYGGVTGVSKGGTLYKNIVQGTATGTVLGGTVGMFAGVIDDPGCITRETNSAGAFVDVFLSIKINDLTVEPNWLYGVRVD